MRDKKQTHTHTHTLTRTLTLSTKNVCSQKTHTLTKQIKKKKENNSDKRALTSATFFLIFVPTVDKHFISSAMYFKKQAGLSSNKNLIVIGNFDYLKSTKHKGNLQLLKWQKPIIGELVVTPTQKL